MRFFTICLIVTFIQPSLTQRGVHFFGERNKQAEVVVVEKHPICAKVDELNEKLNPKDPFDILPLGGEDEVMSIVPKTVNEGMVRSVANTYMGQMRAELSSAAALCQTDRMTACDDLEFILEQMDSDPPEFLPLEVELGLLASLPRKMTPLLLKMVSEFFFESIKPDLKKVVERCFEDAPTCRRFRIKNGEVTYNEEISRADVQCNPGFKARIGDDVVDLVEAANRIKIKCQPNRKWDKLPNCYTCEIGWVSSDHVPGCYRLFPGPVQNIDFHRKTCLRHLGDLASIHSKDELEFVTKLVEKKQSALVGYLKLEDEKTWLPATWSDGTPSTVKWVIPPGSSTKRGCTAITLKDDVPYVVPVDCDKPTTTDFICKRVPTKIS